ncbi:MAG: DUF3788 domain-containing protein [Clostridiales bacterium]|nr:DUF3788 domain-containing protein [Clostridiales bacterium]
MTWNERFTRDYQPSLREMETHIGNPLWASCREQLESRYGIQPRVEHSRCSGAPGWNVKYRKGGRSLCTLYPGEGAFTALVSVSAPEATEAEAILPACTDHVRTLYRNARPLNGSRWLMVEVTDGDILRDVLWLIALRVKPPRQAQAGRA